jgi:hypothetical protein
MLNKKFRNFNVSAKATAIQKQNYRKNAKKEGLSLSEWIVTVLDLYLEQDNTKIIREKSINGFILGFLIGGIVVTIGIILFYLLHKG